MEITLFFESFLIFYLLEIMVLISAYLFYYKIKEQEEIKAESKKEQNGPSASDLIKMRSIAKQLERNV
jgi:uncharacterized membrane protein